MGAVLQIPTVQGDGCSGSYGTTRRVSVRGPLAVLSVGSVGRAPWVRRMLECSHTALLTEEWEYRKAFMPDGVKTLCLFFPREKIKQIETVL